VYDRKFGWDTQQHLGHEFYGDFGTFDVSLDMPNDMVVEATGWLQNPDEVLPAELREKLDIKNFRDKPWNEKPSVITPYDPVCGKRGSTMRKTCMTSPSPPTPPTASATPNGTASSASPWPQEPHASKWQNAADYAAKCIKVHSEQIGMYGYPKMVVADARRHGIPHAHLGQR
jgi:hypothetical protein